MPHIYNAPNIPLAKHAFFGRKGGVSREKYSSLNVNTKSGDDKNIIAQNFLVIMITTELMNKRKT